MKIESFLTVRRRMAMKVSYMGMLNAVRGANNRSKVIGTSIASAPVVAILEGGPQIYIGVEGGIQNINPNVTKTMETFFWRQMSN